MSNPEDLKGAVEITRSPWRRLYHHLMRWYEDKGLEVRARVVETAKGLDNPEVTDALVYFRRADMELGKIEGYVTAGNYPSYLTAWGQFGWFTEIGMKRLLHAADQWMARELLQPEGGNAP